MYITLEWKDMKRYLDTKNSHKKVRNKRMKCTWYFDLSKSINILEHEISSCCFFPALSHLVVLLEWHCSRSTLIYSHPEPPRVQGIDLYGHGKIFLNIALKITDDHLFEILYHWKCFIWAMKKMFTNKLVNKYTGTWNL